MRPGAEVVDSDEVATPNKRPEAVSVKFSQISFLCSVKKSTTVKLLLQRRADVYIRLQKDTLGTLCMCLERWSRRRATHFSFPVPAA